jgi:glycosyltransferase involved in cell wall biosynthesis
MTVFYYLPSSNKPSWGVGMICYHVKLLNDNNINAFVLHDNAGFNIEWLGLKIPVKYLDKKPEISKTDILIVPEFYADNAALQKIKCRKIVFVQNSFYILDGLKSNKTFRELGYESIFYYMPHLQKALKFYSDLPCIELPPFIAPYYFEQKNEKREKNILIYPKFESREYDILKKMLTEKIDKINPNKLSNLFRKNDGWKVIEIKNLSHTNVATLMQKSTLFISLNCTEAFNSSVPEAMASGCINLCYDGYGPKDFLENKKNAYVFHNNNIYPLLEKLFDIIDKEDLYIEELNDIRKSAYATAELYKINELEKVLVQTFKTLSL